MKETSIKKAKTPTTQVAKKSLLIEDGKSKNQCKKRRKLFIESVLTYRKFLSELRSWLIKNSPNSFFSIFYLPIYKLAFNLTLLVTKILSGSWKINGSFATPRRSEFIPLVSDIDINIHINHINRKKLFALDFLAALFPFLSIHIQARKCLTIMNSMFSRLNMEEILLGDWKAWRILTKVLPQHFSSKNSCRLFLNTSRFHATGMEKLDIDKIQNSRKLFHEKRKKTESPGTLEEDWAHILRSLPSNQDDNLKIALIDKSERLRQLEFTSEDLKEFEILFHIGVDAISIDYHPWRYEDKQVIWIIEDEAPLTLVKKLTLEIEKTPQIISPYYKSYPTPIILCRKHMRNTYLPKFAYLPRYTIKNDHTVEVRSPKVCLKPLVAEVIYETTVFLTDVWKMGRDRFARGRVNDMVDGLIPGLIILLKHKILIGDVPGIQMKFKELYPSHPIWDLQMEIRKPEPDIAIIQKWFTLVLAELKEAVLLTDI